MSGQKKRKSECITKYNDCAAVGVNTTSRELRLGDNDYFKKLTISLVG